MDINDFITRMPKIELHVHLEGSIKPGTLLKLAKSNHIDLPVKTIEETRDWYKFTGFPHFIEVYLAICDCIRTPEDMELITREFLMDRVDQNILYSEVIFTPYSHLKNISFDNQLAAINRARSWAENEFGINIQLAPDIAREMRPVEESFQIADWAVANMRNGIVSLGLGGPEIGNPPEVFESTFERILSAGLPATPHAGETEGPASIWGAIRSLHAIRIGHGVRCLEDQLLVDYLREKQIPLEICPTSNVCLGVAKSIERHPLPELLDQGLFITINSDDPPMFNTTLTNEYLKIQETFGYDINQIKNFVFNGVEASLLTNKEKQILLSTINDQFSELEKEI